ncbi:MAG TPA: glycosyltransferase family 9 protein [Terriglobales bacterium]|nr:glycosyltransferase family 9 protein [Terriglobales bacterium]
MHYAVTRPWHGRGLALVDRLGARCWPRPRRREAMVRSVLILRRGSFGDLITVLPAVARLRELYPEARLSWMVQPQYRDFLAAIGAADEFCGRLSGHRRFDLAIDFHADLRMIGWGRLRARRVVGHGIRGGGFLLDPAAPYDWSEPAATRHVRLVEAAAGAPAQTPRPARFRLVPAWRDFAAPLLAELPLHFIIVHPGCGQASKRWPLERWRGLIASLGANQVVLTGVAGDSGACDWLAAATGAMNLAGRTNWASLAAIVAAAAAVIAPDTGIIHLAQALGTPSVGLFGPNDPTVWGYANARHRSLVWRLPCSFCARGRCPRVAATAYSPCMQGVSESAVLATYHEVVAAALIGAGPARLAPRYDRRRMK